MPGRGRPKGSTDKRPRAVGTYSEKRLSGLKPFQPGQSGNAGGRPVAYREAVAEALSFIPEVLDAMRYIVQCGMQGKLTNSDKILSQHLEFIWQCAFGKPPQAVMLTSGDISADPNNPDADASALLRAVRSEMTHLSPAQLRAKADSANVIAVDTRGIATMPPPQAAASSAAPADVEDPDPDDTAYEEDVVEEQVASSPPPPRPKREPRRPSSGFGEFDAYSAEKQRMRDAADAARVEAARAAGRPQLSREEFCPPNDPNVMEVISFTRAKGGGEHAVPHVRVVPKRTQTS